MSPTRGVIQEAWEMYKAHLVRFMTIAATIWIGVAILEAIVFEIGTLAALIVRSIISMIGFFILEAVLVKTVQDVREGHPPQSVGEAFSGVSPFILRIAGAGLLAGLGTGLGFLLLIIPGLVLLTWWVLVPAVIVVENTRLLESFGRSRGLVRGYGWEVFGIIILTYVAALAAGFLFLLVLSPLDQTLEVFFSSLVGGIIINPFVTIAWTLLYFRMAESKAGTGPAAPPPTI